MNNFDKNGFATENTTITVFNYQKDNFEFIGATDEYVVAGSGIPAQSTLIEVNIEKDGYARVFNGSKWEYIEDHRGEDVYSTIDGQKVEIKELGVLPENVTYKPRPSDYHAFIDGDWVEDLEARKQAEKQAKINALNAEMAKLRNDIIFGQAMGDDVSKEIARVKEIREELKSLE